jgi:hypothetical protein
VRPTLEVLEDRTVPTNITYGGGPLLTHVRVNDIVMGAQPVDTSALMQALVRDYLPMLSPYYNVGAGTLRSIASATPFAGNPSNAQVQNLVLREINAGVVAAPDASQLYFVFLAPGQSVSDYTIPDLGGYHSAFLAIHDATGYHLPTPGAVYPSPPQFVVIPYAVQYGQDSQHIQKGASHELAEAVTDPQPFSGYADRSGDLANGEVADIYDFDAPFLLDGYQVAVLSGPQGQMIGTPIPPPTPIPLLQAIFTLYIDGAEKVLRGDSPALEASINANLPWARLGTFDLGSLVVLAGEIAASNALNGGS